MAPLEFYLQEQKLQFSIGAKCSIATDCCQQKVQSLDDTGKKEWRIWNLLANGDTE